MVLCSSREIVSLNFFYKNLPGLRFIKVNRMSLVSHPSSNGRTISLASTSVKLTSTSFLVTDIVGAFVRFCFDIDDITKVLPEEPVLLMDTVYTRESCAAPRGVYFSWA